MLSPCCPLLLWPVIVHFSASFVSSVCASKLLEVLAIVELRGWAVNHHGVAAAAAAALVLVVELTVALQLWPPSHLQGASDLQR